MWQNTATNRILPDFTFPICMFWFFISRNFDETNQKHSVKANSVIIEAQSVTINAPNITLNGNVIINGSLTTSGVISSATDVISKGKSFNSHTHSNVQNGPSNTGVPN